MRGKGQPPTIIKGVKFHSLVVAGVPGRFSWDGAFSTSLYVDPREDMVGILMAQCRPGALHLPPVVLDFWTPAYQAIDD
jgi:CubicO group peptidase (beta-lactamase class C family)